MIETAIILAGGFGTRLQSVVTDLPKPMADVNGQPFLNYQLNYLKQYGVKSIVLSVGYLAEKIKNYYGTEFNGLRITYVTEAKPLGTGGGIRLAAEAVKDQHVFILNGDSFFDVDLNLFTKRHQQSKAQVSLALRTVEDGARYGTLEVNSDQRITSFKEKSGVSKKGLINGGVYILDTKLYLDNTNPLENFSIEKDFFEKKLQTLLIKGFEFNAYFIDIGIPEDYNKAQHEFKNFKYR